MGTQRGTVRHPLTLLTPTTRLFNMKSSWIFDASREDDNTVTMTLENGNKYAIEGMSDDTLRQWQDSDSAGKFFNEDIVLNHTIQRL